MTGDLQARQEGFSDQEIFNLIRIGGVYWIDGKYPVIAGAAHLWISPPFGMTTWGSENRIYQQWTNQSDQGKVSFQHRIRLEERWRDRINDQLVQAKAFSFRMRYLVTFQANVFRNHNMPALVIADELMAQFGAGVIYNTFDQNRLFFGLRVPVSKNLSFDTGYMYVIQQRPAGSIYDVSNIFRLFIYWSVDLYNKKLLQQGENGAS